MVPAVAAVHELPRTGTSWAGVDCACARGYGTQVALVTAEVETHRRHWKVVTEVGRVEHEPAAGPPGDVALTLEQALDLLAALEDARDILVGTDHLSVLAHIEDQIQRLSRKLGFDQGGPDAI